MPATPDLYTRPLDGSHHSVRLPGGPRGPTGRPGPVAVDLYGHRLAVAWEDLARNGPFSSGPAFDDARLLLDTLGGHQTLVDRAGSGDSQAEIAGPSFDAGSVYYSVARGDASSLRRYRYSTRTRTRTASPVTGFVVSLGRPGRAGDLRDHPAR